MGLICIHFAVLNMIILKQNVMMFTYFCICSKNCEKKKFRIFLQTRRMVGGAKFNSHDSGGHF